MQNSNDILNKVLKGEHMAIDLYGTYLDQDLPEDLKDEMKSIQADHQRHAALLTEYIKKAGGTPTEGSGFGGWMAESMARIQTTFVPDVGEILSQLYDGEDKGLARSVQLSEDHLAETERSLLEPILSDEHDHLKTLDNLIKKYKH